MLSKITIFDKVFDFFTGVVNAIIDFVLEFFNNIGLGIGGFIGEWLNGYGMVIQIPSNIFDVLNDVTRGIGYILPLAALTPIVNFMITFYVIKIIFSLYRVIASTTIRRVKIKT